jgi:hypothetical protein
MRLKPQQPLRAELVERLHLNLSKGCTKVAHAVRGMHASYSVNIPRCVGYNVRPEPVDELRPARPHCCASTGSAHVPVPITPLQQQMSESGEPLAAAGVRAWPQPCVP